MLAHYARSHRLPTSELMDFNDTTGRPQLALSRAQRNPWKLRMFPSPAPKGQRKYPHVHARSSARPVRSTTPPSLPARAGGGSAPMEGGRNQPVNDLESHAGRVGGGLRSCFHRLQVKVPFSARSAAIGDDCDGSSPARPLDLHYGSMHFPGAARDTGAQPF